MKATRSEVKFGPKPFQQSTWKISGAVCLREVPHGLCRASICSRLLLLALGVWAFGGGGGHVPFPTRRVAFVELRVQRRSPRNRNKGKRVKRHQLRSSTVQTPFSFQQQDALGHHQGGGAAGAGVWGRFGGWVLGKFPGGSLPVLLRVLSKRVNKNQTNIM